MKQSRRAMRMERTRRSGATTINLVPMIDLLTVLVFFLLVNAGDVVTAPTTKALRLPTSTAQAAPKLTPQVQVTPQDIIVEGRLIAKVADVMKSDSRVIPELVQEMRFQAERTAAATSKNTAHGEVTILADQGISYALVKKVMVSCTQADYAKVSLAVNTKSAK
jgi:biopolymer transport protein ExbD